MSNIEFGILPVSHTEINIIQSLEKTLVHWISWLIGDAPCFLVHCHLSQRDKSV